MRQVYLFLFSLLVFDQLQAQKVYFITIDADNNQPYSVVVATRNYSSSSRGHLIIPNLIDSTYYLTVNFPGNIFPEHVFEIKIQNKDNGYQLKKTGEKSWGLFNWQSLELIKPEMKGTKPGSNEIVAAAISKDAFARMMAAIVNDSAVLFTSIAKPAIVKRDVENKPDKSMIANNEKRPGIVEVKKEDSAVVSLDKAEKIEQDTVKNLVTTKPIADTSTGKSEKYLNKELARSPVGVLKDKKDDSLVSSVANTNFNDSTKINTIQLPPFSEKKSIPANLEEPKKSFITSLGERWTKESRELIFTDSLDGSLSDTIRVIIEIELPPSYQKETKDSNTVMAGKLKNINDSLKFQSIPPGTTVTERKQDSVLAVSTVTKIRDTTVAKKEALTSPEKKIQLINSDCRNFASDIDVDKLRVKMLSESNLDERIVLAKKVFRAKCFTTKQVKALTELFVNDKTRYGFFDAAYPFVSDAENFKGLVELLTDEYYINRFKVMVRM